MKKRIVAPTICLYALIAVIFHAYWGFVFKQTVYANTALTYLVFLLPLFLIFVTLAKLKRFRGSFLFIAWAPFLLWRFIGMMTDSSVEIASPWLVAFLLMFIASSVDINQRIPYKFLVISGFIVVIGILIEVISPSFYFSTIYPLFDFEGTFDSQTMFEEGYGCSGFMNQLDRAAMPMIFAEGALLFVLIPNKENKRYGMLRTLRIVGLVLLIICIFLTGKRMASVVSIITPVAAYYFSQKNAEKKIKIIFLGLLGAFLAYIVFILFFDFFSESIGVGRLLETLSDSDASSVNVERDWRWEFALKLYNSSPIIGMGVNYIENSGHLAVHNYYLQVLAEQGLFGLFFFMMPLIATFISCRNLLITTKDPIERRSVLYALYCFIAVSFCMITENGDIFMMPIFFMAISMIISGRKSNIRYNIMKLSNSLQTI